MSLKLFRVKKVFRDGIKDKTIIDDLTIEFPKFGLYGITGTSGCGKTTLLNIINGIEKVTKGQVRVDDREINSQVRARYFSYAYQDPVLIPFMKIKDNLLAFNRVLGIETKEALLKKYIHKFEIKDILDKYPNQISGGQAARASLIRAMIGNKPILLCDEPTAALNNQLANKVMQELKDYSRNHLVIVVSHQLKLMTRFCDSIINLDIKQDSYFFNKKAYNRYSGFFKKQKSRLFSLVCKQLGYQKNKIIVMIISQILLIAVSLILIFAIDSFKQRMIKSLKTRPDSLIVELRKREINHQFTRKELLKLKAQKGRAISVNYLLDLGIINYNGKQVPFNSQVIFDDLKTNGVVINRSLAKKLKIKKNQNLEYELFGYKTRFKVEKIVENGINDPDLLYFNPQEIEAELLDRIKDPGTAILLVKDYSKIRSIINSLQNDYICFSSYQTKLDTYSPLIKIIFGVLLLFVFISVLVGCVLMQLILKTILEEQKKFFVLLLINGLSVFKVVKANLIVGAGLGLFIGILGCASTRIMLLFINCFHLGELIIGKEIVDKMQAYEFFIILYLFLTAIIAGKTGWQFRKVNYSIELRNQND